MRLAAKLFIFLPCVAAMFAQIPVTINTASPLPPATNFQGYSQPIIATGGGGSYLWSEVRPASGTDPNCPGPLTGLPPGLTVSASAQAASASVGIRPISSGDWTFCVQADDNAGSVARKQFQLRVNAEPIVNLANTVTVAAGTPAITGVNPNTGRQGTNNLNVAIAGQFTNWAQGSTTVNLGAGITVNSVTVGGQPAGAGFASQVLADNPKGFWFLNDVPGTPTTAIDSSVSAFNGTYGPGVTAHGIAGPSWVPPSGLVANFTGGTISFPSLLNLGSSGYTIEAWINPSLSSLTQTTRIVASGSGLNGYGFGTAAGGGLVFTSFSRQDYVTTGLTLLPNQWQYVGVVLDASSDAHFYVNGSLVESVAGALATLAPTGNFTIGNQSPGVGHTDEIFTGGLAGISVYDTALTAAQIQAQYNAAAATSLTADISIAANAAVGARGLTVTTAAEVVSLASAFTVTAGTPVILSVNPNTGKQGSNNLNVVIGGQFTSWVQGSTTVGLGAGITVNSVTVSSATSLTANVSIAANAAVGARGLTVTTGAEVVSLANAFTVTPGTPVISSVNPNTGQQGSSNLNVAIGGQFTNWVQGSTTVGLGAGITVNSVTVSSATSLTANVSIAANAAAGARGLTVTTGAEVVSLANAFTVTAGTPVITSVNPNTGQQGTSNLNVVIGGQFSSWVQGSTTVSLGAGITVNSVTVSSATSLTANVSIAANAAVGARNLTVTAGAEVLSLANAFTVTAGTPVISSVNPNTGQQGSSNLNVVIGGQFTNWAQGSTTVSLGAGITVNSVTVSSATSLTANVSIAANASGGARNLTVTTGAEVVNLANAFTVTAGTPVINSVNPNTGQQGTSNLNVAIGGQFTNWAQGSTTVSLGAGITVNSVTVNSATSLTANVSIAANAATGARNLTVTTGAEVVNLANAFTVTAGTPVINSVNPNTAQQGTNNLNVAIGGQFTNWAQGSTTVSLGAGITVNSVTVGSATSLTANVSIAANAAAGARNLTVTTGAEVVNLANAFTLTAGTPVISSVNPNTGQQGSSNLNVVIAGQFTNWAQGSTTVSLGAGITVNSVTVSSATSLTANVSIAANASGGARNLTVTTGAEIVNLANAFTVTAGTPVITSVNPNTGQQGTSNLNMAITGQITNWAQGSTTVSLGAGITVNSVTVSSTTSLTANVSIAANAAAGARNLTVTTGSTAVNLANAFTVTAGAPAITSLNPNASQVGSNNLSVAIAGQFTNWAQGSTAVSLGAGITINSITVSSVTSLTANISVAANSTGGARNLTVTTGAEVVTMANAFTVTAGIPVITSVNPNTGQQGTNNLNVAMGGQFTNWIQGSTTVSLGAGITVNSVTVSSATSLTANVSIVASAAVGVRNLTVTTGSEVINLANAFTVTAGTPVITSANPNAGQMGTNNLNVAVAGQFTNWAQGSTTVSLGAGITVNSVTVGSVTSLTANVSITASAAFGARSLTVTTGAEFVTLANGFTVTAGTPVIISVLAFTGQPSNTPAGFTMNPVTVRLTADGNPVSGTAVTLSLANSSVPLFGTLTRMTDANGQALFNNLSVRTAGFYRLAADAAPTSDLSIQFEITAAPAMSITATSGMGQTANAGTAYLAPLKASVQDMFGNRVPGALVTFITPPSTGPSVAFTGSASVTTDNTGTATSPAMTANTRAGGFLVTATVPGAVSPAVFALTNAANAPGRLAFVQQPTDTQAGATIVPPLTVQLLDSFGNAVHTGGVPVTVALNPAAGAAPPLKGTATQNTDIYGLAMFGDLGSVQAGNYQFIAQSGSLGSTTSAAFQITSGAPAVIRATAGTPQSTVVLTAFSAPLEVTVTDTFGNPVSGASVVFTAPAAGASGAFGGAFTAPVTTGERGIASVRLTANGTPGSYVVSATTSAVAGAATFSLTNVAAPARVLAFVQQPGAVASGQAISPAVTVQVRDSSGAPVNTAGIAISMALASGTGELTGSRVSVTAANGIATFDNLRVDLAGTKRLRATALELTLAESNSFAVTAGQASHIAAAGNTPQVTMPFQAFAAPLQALVTDSMGNPVSGAPVTFSVPATGPSGSFSEAPTVTTTVNGIATSPALTANKTAGSFSAIATTPNVAGMATFALVILPPTSAVLTLGEQVLTFVSEIDQPAPPAKTVTVSAASGAAAVAWTASPSASWLTVSPISGVTPGQVSVSVNPASLIAGTYLQTVTFTPPGGEVVVLVVSYTITPKPALSVSPGSLIFQTLYQSDGTIPIPSAQTLSATSSSRSIGYQASTTVTSPPGGTWLKLSAAQGQTPGAVQASVTPFGLAEGVYRGSILFQPTEAGIGPVYVPVTLVVGCNRGGCAAPLAEPPVILGIVNSASFHISGAPGAAMTIFGRNLSATTTQALVYPLPTTLGATMVRVNGAPVPLYYVSPGQINFQIPGDTSTGTARVEVNAGGEQQSAVVQSTTVTAVDPGLYMNGSLAAALNSDLTPHTPATPQAPGTILAFFLTGQGMVTPGIPDGSAAPVTPLSLLNGTVQVTIGGQAAEVTFAGLAPGYAGLAQVNVRIPQGLSPGNHPALIVINGVPSNAGLISVR